LQTLKVDLGERSYGILIGEGLIGQTGEFLRAFSLSGRILLVSNPTVYDLYGRETEKALNGAQFQVAQAVVPDGERYKNLETVSWLYDRALDARLDRRSAIVALGGGVIGDTAGFLAATFLRGIPLIQLPTTLLAQVDSSVGGKVGVNHDRGKNLIGSFYQPLVVVADIGTLKTLPVRELRSGAAEVIKYGVIWEAEFFAFLEQNLSRVLALDPGVSIQAVERSCMAKSQVVGQDEREQGLRAILNFGHTLGHAVETLTNYERYRHGEAVAIGMVAAANLAVSRGMMPEPDRDRLVKIIQGAGLPIGATGLSPTRILETVQYDKKAEAGKLKLVLPEVIGRVRLVDDVSEAEILGAAATIC